MVRTNVKMGEVSKEIKSDLRHKTLKTRAVKNYYNNPTDVIRF